jgi:hypothetical protein
MLLTRQDWRGRVKIAVGKFALIHFPLDCGGAGLSTGTGSREGSKVGSANPAAIGMSRQTANSRAAFVTL